MDYAVIEDRDCGNCKHYICGKCVVWDCNFEKCSNIQNELYVIAKHAIIALKKDNKYLANLLISEVIDK